MPFSQRSFTIGIQVTRLQYFYLSTFCCYWDFYLLILSGSLFEYVVLFHGLSYLEQFLIVPVGFGVNNAANAALVKSTTTKIWQRIWLFFPQLYRFVVYCGKPKYESTTVGLLFFLQAATVMIGCITWKVYKPPPPEEDEGDDGSPQPTTGRNAVRLESEKDPIDTAENRNEYINPSFSEKWYTNCVGWCILIKFIMHWTY